MKCILKGEDIALVQLRKSPNKVTTSVVSQFSGWGRRYAYFWSLRAFIVQYNVRVEGQERKQEGDLIPVENKGELQIRERTQDTGPNWRSEVPEDDDAGEQEFGVERIKRRRQPRIHSKGGMVAD